MERKRSVRRYGSRRYKKSFGAKCKDFWRNFIAFMFSNVGIIGLVVGYTIAGAFMFQAIEGVPDAGDTSRAPSLAAARNQTAAQLWALLEAGDILPVESDAAKWRLLAEPALQVYTQQVVDAVRDGFEGEDDEAEDLAQKWAFPGAFLYSLTVITTIGYGNVSPKKPWGKIMTIVYAIAGMPLFLLYLSNIGDILARCFKWLYAKCCLCRWCPNVAKRREERRRRRLELVDDGEEFGTERRHTAVSMQAEEFPMQQLPVTGVEEEDEEDGSEEGTYDEEYDPQTVTVPVTICLTIMVGYVCGGALLFAEYEGWDYLDGSYFCFISLSTIGFGDIVPGVNTYYSSRQGLAMSFVFCSMYLMLGMALIAMCFNLMQEEVIHKIRKIVRTAKRIFR